MLYSFVKMRVKEGLTMAHMMKHTRAGCGHMFAHYDRQAEHKRRYRAESNSEVSGPEERA